MRFCQQVRVVTNYHKISEKPIAGSIILVRNTAESLKKNGNGNEFI